MTEIYVPQDQMFGAEGQSINHISLPKELIENNISKAKLTKGEADIFRFLGQSFRYFSPEEMVSYKYPNLLKKDSYHLKAVIPQTCQANAKLRQASCELRISSVWSEGKMIAPVIKQHELLPDLVRQEKIKNTQLPERVKESLYPICVLQGTKKETILRTVLTDTQWRIFSELISYPLSTSVCHSVLSLAIYPEYSDNGVYSVLEEDLILLRSHISQVNSVLANLCPGVSIASDWNVGYRLIENN